MCIHSIFEDEKLNACDWTHVIINGALIEVVGGQNEKGIASHAESHPMAYI